MGCEDRRVCSGSLTQHEVTSLVGRYSITRNKYVFQPGSRIHWALCAVKEMRNQYFANTSRSRAEFHDNHVVLVASSWSF